MNFGDDFGEYERILYGKVGIGGLFFGQYFFVVDYNLSVIGGMKGGGIGVFGFFDYVIYDENDV